MTNELGGESSPVLFADFVVNILLQQDPNSEIWFDQMLTSIIKVKANVYQDTNVISKQAAKVVTIGHSIRFSSEKMHLKLIRLLLLMCINLALHYGPVLQLVALLFITYLEDAIIKL